MMLGLVGERERELSRISIPSAAMESIETKDDLYCVNLLDTHALAAKTKQKLIEKSEDAARVGRTSHKEEGTRRGCALVEHEEQPYLGWVLAADITRRGRPLPPIIFLLLPHHLASTHLYLLRPSGGGIRPPSSSI
jgi:hypothetical protein